MRIAHSFVVALVCLLSFGCARTSLPAPPDGELVQAQDVADPEIVSSDSGPMPSAVAGYQQATQAIHAPSQPVSVTQPASHGDIATVLHEATTQATTANFQHGVQVYDFIDGGVYEVLSTPFHGTTIMLQPEEELITLSAGDTKRWLIESGTSGSPEGSRWVIMVKPWHKGLHTNLLIGTSKRTYLVALQSTQSTYLMAVRWHYPREAMHRYRRQRTKEQHDARQVIASHVNIAALDFGYVITSSSNPRWLPVRVFDDGSKTYIQFPPTIASSEAPVLFIMRRGQSTQMVNYRYRPPYYVVDRLFDVAELRVGDKKPDVVRIIRKEDRDGRTAHTR